MAQHDNCEVTFSDIVGSSEMVVVQFIDGRSEANVIKKVLNKKSMIKPYYGEVSKVGKG